MKDPQEIFDEALKSKKYVPHEITITWCNEDLLWRAIERKGRSWSKIYDLSKFSEALDELERHHDCEYGITWDSIDYA